MRTLPSVLRHLAIACGFALFAILWTFPLASHLSSTVPGDPGDNLDFLWNTWWMRQAVTSPAVNFFRTTRLFAPFGVDLTLHTHTAFPSWVAAAVFGGFPVVTAHNLVILVTVAANGFAAYLLAWSRLRDRGAAVVAGLIFGGAPYIAGHLMGHLNLVAGWTLPLFLLFYLRATGGVLRPSSINSRRSFIGAAVCLALTAYTDYYYLVYSIVLAAGLWVTAVWTIDFKLTRTRAPKALLIIAGVLLAIDAAIVIAIVTTGGFVTDLAGIHITANRPTNALAIGWLLVLIGFLSRFRVSTIIASQDGRRYGRDLLRAAWPALVVFGVAILPLAISGVELLQRGDYTSPVRSWRSGPPGVDLATLVFGNPWHPVTGTWTRALYDRLGIDKVEGSAWLGIAPLLLALSLLRKRHLAGEPRLWRRIGIVFFIWSLGPWLKVAGFDTGLLLPQNLFDFVPILSNARMPGRALVVVMLALAMLAALTIKEMSPRVKRAAIVGALLLTAIDYVPAPFPMTTLELPPIYRHLLSLQDGALLELPVGLRDGFGTTGRFDDRVALYQMTHGRSIAGGFLARIPQSIKTRYDETPVLRSLLRLSAGDSVDPRDQNLSREAIGAALGASGMKFVMLNRATAPAALVAFVERRIPLRVIAREGERDLYEIP